MIDDREYYEAFVNRDRDFDGVVFVGVISTKIYCLPSCPARKAKFENCRYFGSGEACVAAGFRACKRCRPAQKLTKNGSSGRASATLPADLKSTL